MTKPEAVECGYWNLFRFNPRAIPLAAAAGRATTTFSLDSAHRQRVRPQAARAVIRQDDVDARDGQLRDPRYNFGARSKDLRERHPSPPTGRGAPTSRVQAALGQALRAGLRFRQRSSPGPRRCIPTWRYGPARVQDPEHLLTWAQDQGRVVQAAGGAGVVQSMSLTAGSEADLRGRPRT